VKLCSSTTKLPKLKFHTAAKFLTTILKLSSIAAKLPNNVVKLSIDIVKLPIVYH
jgi:hypothetical protein